MRYARRGGYTPAEQQRREQLRLDAAARFARDKISQRTRLAGHPGVGAAVAPGLGRGRTGALRSRGPVSAERHSARQWAWLELELGKGPLARGFAADQRWTLGRIKTLAGRLFHVAYTVEGTWKLMRRHGWSCQVPARQAMERDEEAVAAWKAEVRPDIKEPRATWVPSSVSRQTPSPRAADAPALANPGCPTRPGTLTQRDRR